MGAHPHRTPPPARFAALRAESPRTVSATICPAFHPPPGLLALLIRCTRSATCRGWAGAHSLRPGGTFRRPSCMSGASDQEAGPSLNPPRATRETVRHRRRKLPASEKAREDPLPPPDHHAYLPPAPAHDWQKFEARTTLIRHDQGGPVNFLSHHRPADTDADAP